MARYRPIYVKMWSDVEFMEYTPEAKLLFIYLCTNPLTTESGIYQLALKTTSYYTGLTAENIEILLSTVLKNVVYDKDSKYIFLRRFRRYNTGGKPELIQKSIISDFEQSHHSYLWTIFLEEYPEYKDVIKNTKPIPNPLQTVIKPLTNPLPTVDQPLETEASDKPLVNRLETVSKPILPYLTYKDSTVVNRGMVTKGIETLPDNKIVSNVPNKDLGYWMDELNKASGNGHKVGILVDAFKCICSQAPQKDFDNLGGRLAGMSKKIDCGIILRNIYLCPAYKPDGSWLDYIDKMPKSKYGNNNNTTQQTSTKLKRAN